MAVLYINVSAGIRGSIEPITLKKQIQSLNFERKFKSNWEF